jgi:ABC-type uncharacterized transport system involved in gliding motility auxiliary subunit
MKKKIPNLNDVQRNGNQAWLLDIIEKISWQMKMRYDPEVRNKRELLERELVFVVLKLAGRMKTDQLTEFFHTMVKIEATKDGLDALKDYCSFDKWQEKN